MPPLGASPPPPPEGGEEGFEMSISVNDYELIIWVVLQPPVGVLAMDSTLGICTAHLEYILMYIMGGTGIHYAPRLLSHADNRIQV